jgi:hypothetical protein
MAPSHSTVDSPVIRFTAHSTGWLAITAAKATQPGAAGTSSSADPARNPSMISECQPVNGNIT